MREDIFERTLGSAYTLTRDDDDRVLSGVRIESITPITTQETA